MKKLIFNFKSNDVKTAKPVLNVMYLKTFKKENVSTKFKRKL